LREKKKKSNKRKNRGLKKKIKRQSLAASERADLLPEVARVLVSTDPAMVNKPTNLEETVASSIASESPVAASQDIEEVFYFHLTS
jgi:hypothetical protein